MRIQEAIVVEGRYDKNTLAQLVDTVILETSGFGIFHDKAQLELLRRVAEKRGLIVLTDSDGAGFVIRNYLKSALPKEQVKHAYIPDQKGKERHLPGFAAGGRPGGTPDQGRPLCLGAVRGRGEPGEAEKAPGSPGPARASLPQCHAAGALCPV